MSKMQGRSGWMAGLLLSAVLAMAGLSAAHAGAPKPVIEKAVKGEQCVEDTDFMRRNHMKVLDHHRDKTVIEGVRTRQHSLKGCIDCHASAKTGSVAAAKENFCVSCHSFAAVKLDCFECHASKPGKAVPPAGHPKTGAGMARPLSALRLPATERAR
jgi:hypothetical protein